jgi:hypothetical protein
VTIHEMSPETARRAADLAGGPVKLREVSRVAAASSFPAWNPDQQHAAW